jgi:VIT1/CCC1 family predicted Fe2+/Mn2+ transporter
MKTSALYLRTVIFGIIDALVSTVGLLAGVDVTGASHKVVALTGIIYAFVEAFSMAVGNFLSEESAEEYMAKATINGRNAFGAGIVMFIASVLSAFVPIVPYLIFSTDMAFFASIGFSIVALFVVGIISGRIAKLPMLSRGIRMALLGGAAITIGSIVGLLVPTA